ncbi:MAG: ABC transporter substrate-binding protein [Betaproteobacteria bacterium]
MTRLIFLLLLTLAPVAFAQPVVVGAAVPRTGSLAAFGADFGKALELWRDEVNAAGGLLGRPVELVLLDDASEAFESPAHYRKLIEAHRADLLVGPVGSAATLGAAATAERARRVLVNATGASRLVHRARTRYVFQVAAPYAAYGSGALEVAQRQGLRRLFIAFREDPQSKEMAQQARDQAVKLGFQVDEPAPHAPGSTGLDQLVERAQRFEAEAWITFGSAADASGLVQTFRRTGYAPRMLLAQGAADPAFIRLVGQDAEMVMGVAPYEARAATSGNAAFVAAYTKRWSAAPGLLAAQGYAAAKVLEAAVKRAGSVEQDKLRDALSRLETATPLGPYQVDANGAQLAARPAVVQIQRGRREIVWPEALATAEWQLPYPAWAGRKLIQ